MHRKLKTPCIGICSTTYGDVVCRGCKRFLHEIIDWNKYQEADQGVIWQRLEELLVHVMRNHVFITDVYLLEDRLRAFEIPHNPESDPYCWVQSLLTHAEKKGITLFECGVMVLSQSEGLAIRQMNNQIDEEYFALSEAHYDRSFARSNFLNFDD